jgi:DNA-directed RNA polymerase subunit RPC12/RpoP
MGRRKNVDVMNNAPTISCPNCNSNLVTQTASSLRCAQCGHQFDAPVTARYEQPDIPPRPPSGRPSPKNPLGM